MTQELEARLNVLRNEENESLRNHEIVREEREAVEQELLEARAEVIQYGDDEPDVPSGGKRYRAANGGVYYRTLLDGWRWEGECLYGTSWEHLPESLFHMTQLVGNQLDSLGEAKPCGNESGLTSSTTRPEDVPVGQRYRAVSRTGTLGIDRIGIAQRDYPEGREQWTIRWELKDGGIETRIRDDEVVLISRI